VSFLIVDDNRHIRRMLRGMLNNAFPGVDVLDAANGQAACASCAKHEPRVVLMDVELPDANGIDLVARITGLLPATRVIVVSNHDTLGHRDRAFIAGAWAFIHKDHVSEKLVPTLKAVLAAGHAKGV
jgi:two-component system response regulator YesN